MSKGFPASLKDVARLSDVGVTVFFVISGFLITTLLLAEDAKQGSINLRNFYTRRILRIFPVYFLFIAFIIFWGNIEKLNITHADLLYALTFTVNFNQNRNWFLGHFWSLGIEEQFYIFWPVILIVFRKRVKIILAALIAYSCLVRVIAYKFPAYKLIILSPFFSYSDAIFVGVFGAIIYFENPEIIKNKIFNSYCAQFLAVCLFCLFVYLKGFGKLAILSLPFTCLVVSVSTLFLIFAYIKPSGSPFYKLLNNKVIVHIGILSYSIYIWQELFFVGELNGLWRTFPFNIPVIYVVALASYYLWEKPFLRLKNKFSPKKLQVQTP